MKRFFMVLSIVFITFLASCSTQTFHINEGNSSSAKVDKAQPFFVYGIGQKQELNAADICGGVENIIKVETETTFLNGLLGTLTLGLYTPNQARVYCR